MELRRLTALMAGLSVLGVMVAGCDPKPAEGTAAPAANETKKEVAPAPEASPTTEASPAAETSPSPEASPAVTGDKGVTEKLKDGPEKAAAPAGDKTGNAKTEATTTGEKAEPGKTSSDAVKGGVNAAKGMLGGK